MNGAPKTPTNVIPTLRAPAPARLAPRIARRSNGSPAPVARATRGPVPAAMSSKVA